MFRRKTAAIIAVLLLVLMSVPVCAADKSTAWLITPIVSHVDPTLNEPYSTYFIHDDWYERGDPSVNGATAPSDPPEHGTAELLNVVYPYWCGVNDYGAYSFSDMWCETGYRYPVNAPVDRACFRFFIEDVSYTVGEVIRLKTNFISQYGDAYFDCVQVRLIPYWSNASSENALVVYEDTDGDWDGIIDFEGGFSKLYYTPTSTGVKEKVSYCEKLILAIDIYGPKANNRVDFTAKGRRSSWYIQFSNTSNISFLDPEVIALEKENEQLQNDLNSLKGQQATLNSQLNSLKAEQDATEKKLEDLGDKQDQTNNKLDNIAGQPEQEKNEASGTGNDGVGELTGVIPDYSSGFISGMQNLTTALSYNGTSCVWTVPQLYIPPMTGVSSAKIPLTDGDLKVDLGSWVQKLPDKILTVIRLVLTIALIIYCVKELYDTIQYALTLKSGGSS